VFIVTSNNKRLTFLRCISEGVTDYILKPFEDEFLVEKVLSALKQKNAEQSVPDRFVFDIHNYLKAELKKATKGRYNLTLVMCALINLDVEGITAMERKYTQAINSFYEIVLKDLWDTDIFERYGSQTFVGVFPYCNSSDAEKIVSKLNVSYDNVQNELRNVSPLRLAVVSLTCPTEITEPKQLLLTLAEMLENKVEQIKEKNNESE
jgi:PleD family two-component response regulator